MGNVRGRWRDASERRATARRDPRPPSACEEGNRPNVMIWSWLISPTAQWRKFRNYGRFRSPEIVQTLATLDREVARTVGWAKERPAWKRGGNRITGEIVREYCVGLMNLEGTVELCSGARDRRAKRRDAGGGSIRKDESPTPPKAVGARRSRGTWLRRRDLNPHLSTPTVRSPDR
jgi:hypothetical protein